MAWLWFMFAVTAMVLVALLVGFAVYLAETRWSSAAFWADPERWCAQRTRFYHLHQSNNNIQGDDMFSDGGEWCAAVDDSLRQRGPFQHYHEGYVTRNGLPGQLQGQVVIVHVHGPFTGVNPRWPRVNAVLSGGHALPVSDTLVRYMRLRLSNVVVIGFRMPTDGLSTISFGQGTERIALDVAIRHVLKHVKGQIYLSGDCLGALRIERWLATRPVGIERIAGLIMCSPLSNAERIFGQKQLFWRAFELVMPNLRRDLDALNVSRIEINSLVAILEDDPMCSRDDSDSIARRFPNSRLLVVPNGSKSQHGKLVEHGEIWRWPPYRVALLDFLHLKQGEAIEEHGVTVVTALYDIGREQKGDGRSFEKYLQWFSETLRLRAPMVVFVDPDLVEFVKTHRAPGYPTEIVGEHLALPDLHRIRKITKMNTWSGDLAFKLPEYTALIYRKFHWLQRAIKMDSFGSKSFAWVDAGQSRFWPKNFAPEKVRWPHPSWTHLFEKSDKIVIQGRVELGRQSYKEVEMRIGTSGALMWATVIAGNAAAMQRLCQDMEDLLEFEMLQKERIDTEQVAIQLLWAKDQNRFHVITPRHAGNLWGFSQIPELVQILAKPHTKP